MGFIRGFFLFIVVCLLFVSLLAGNLLLTLTMSLNYDNVNMQLSSTVTDIVQGQVQGAMEDLGVTESDLNLTQEVDDRIDEMKDYCVNNTEETEYTFSYEDYTFIVPCETVDQGTEAIINKSVENVVERIYYKEYDCGFWDCLQEGEPYVLVSEQARDYWKSKFYISLVASIILAVLAFFLVQKKKNFPILLGASMAILALPFIKLDSWIGAISDSTYMNLANVFVSESTTVFWIMFIPGIILVILGIVFHFISLGTKFAKWTAEREAKKKQKEAAKKVVKK